MIVTIAATEVEYFSQQSYDRLRFRVDVCRFLILVRVIASLLLMNVLQRRCCRLWNGGRRSRGDDECDWE